MPSSPAARRHGQWLLVVLLLAAFPACHPLEPYQTERFDLTAGPAAAEGYPMEIVEGRFITSDGKSIPFGAEFLEGDWGLSHSGVVGGDGTAPAPDSLEVRWFSYPEDKFYEGHFLLPQKTIYDLLKQGYWNAEDKRQETYNELTVCLLPKGVVVVWLSGQNQVLLGRYEGHEINFDFKRFNEAANRPLMMQQEQAKLPAAVQAAIRTHSLNTRQWDTYLKTYAWNLAFSQPLKLYDCGSAYFNGEIRNASSSRTVPSHVQTLLTLDSKPIPSNYSTLLFLVIDFEQVVSSSSSAAFQPVGPTGPRAGLAGG